MASRGLLLAAALAAAIMLPSTGGAQVFAVDRDCGCVYSFQDTTGTRVSPLILNINQAGRMTLDHRGRVLVAGLVASSRYAVRIDPDTQGFDLLFPTSLLPGYAPVGIDVDEGDDVFLLMHYIGAAGTDRDPTPYDFIARLPGGNGPPEVAYTFVSSVSVIDMKFRPPGANEGKLVVLAEDVEGGGTLFYELQRTGVDTFAYFQTIADGGMMPADPRAFDFDTYGTIILVDYSSGLFYVDEEYGYVWEFGAASGPGLGDIVIDSSGVIYLANIVSDRIERFDAAGVSIGSPFGHELSALRAVTVAGYTPTPVGEYVLVEPWENVEITFEGITEAGFTTAVVETSSSHVSPEGNFLPEYAFLPGSRPNYFTYISLATDAVYENGLQVDVLLEGSRLFFASGVGDTFRDFTVVGSIEDARGTIPRFTELPDPGVGRPDSDPTEVVLAEDTRELSEVTAYKFWRLSLAMATPDTVPFCPWGAIHGLKSYAETARYKYDLGDYAGAIDELAVMNGQLREYAGWCIPNSSADELNDMIALILGHSKTLMFSIYLESWAGVDEHESALALSVTNPATDGCRMALSGPPGTQVRLTLYDVAGRLVATLFDDALPEGGAEVVWDGTDSSGHRAASGVYFARAEAGGDLRTSKVVLLR